MPNGFYVEVIDLDGVTHHIGPFKARSNARDWIEQNPLDGDRHQRPAWSAKGQPLHEPEEVLNRE